MRHRLVCASSVLITAGVLIAWGLDGPARGAGPGEAKPEATAKAGAKSPPGKSDRFPARRPLTKTSRQEWDRRRAGVEARSKERPKPAERARAADDRQQGIKPGMPNPLADSLRARGLDPEQLIKDREKADAALKAARSMSIADLEADIKSSPRKTPRETQLWLNKTLILGTKKSEADGTLDAKRRLANQRLSGVLGEMFAGEDPAVTEARRLQGESDRRIQKRAYEESRYKPFQP